MKTIPRHIKYLDRMREIILSMREPVVVIKRYRENNEDNVHITAINREGMYLYIYDGYANETELNKIESFYKSKYK